MSALVPSKDENIERTDPLSPYYPKKELGAFRRLENGSVFALLRTLEKAPVTHVRTSSEGLDDVILPEVPDKIEYEREDKQRLFIQPSGLSIEELAEMMLVAGKFAKNVSSINELPPHGVSGTGWVWFPAPTAEERLRIEEETRELVDRWKATRAERKPRRQIASPHSEIGAQGRRLEGSDEIEVLEP